LAAAENFIIFLYLAPDTKWIDGLRAVSDAERWVPLTDFAMRARRKCEPFPARARREADDGVDLKAEQRCQGRRFDRDLGR
jgi:hypothetical protein